MHKTMDNAYKTVFGLGSNMYNALKSGYDKIVNSIHGMSPEELAARTSQTTNAAAAASKNVQRSIGQRAAMTGAVPGVESGIIQSQRSAADTAVLTNMSNQQADITAEDYATGRKERDFAMQQEAKLGGEVFEPAAQFAGADISSAKEQSEQADANQAASSSWMGVLGGVASSAIGAVGTAAGCVVPDTMIRLAHGVDCKAGELQEGMLLFGFDGAEVIKVLSRSIQPCVRITLNNGAAIEVSESHTFFSPTGGYVGATEALGRYLMTDDSNNLVVGVKKIEAQQVIKIHLSHSHGYVSNGIWSLE
jgi:hypothetical protein